MLAVLMAGITPPATYAAGTAYVEPVLLTSQAGSVSVIVAATDSQVAANAVAGRGGQVTSNLWLINSVAATLPAHAVAAVAAMPGVQSIVLNHGLKSSDASVADVQPTNSKKVWKIAYPVTVDIGADSVHTTRLPSGKRIDGESVTVAVVDSGVFFDKEVRRELGAVVQKNFLGQADFVDGTCQPTPGSNKQIIGTQADGYCALTWRDSADGFGHGTAVASVIWNNFTDANTGTKLGVAPGANVLSVRVLDNDGQGSYETVIKGIQY